VRGSEDSWAPLPAAPLLHGHEVHVVRVALGVEPLHASRLLSAEEAGRARALRSPEHRRRFVTAHGWLREVLGRYVGAAPESLWFTRSEDGKPSLVDPRGGEAGLRFNLSHSGEVGLIAIGRGREVGVDVEEIKARRDVVGLARRALEPAAARELEGLGVEERVAGFHRLWARHEARLKCLGSGLTGSPRAGSLQVFDLDAGAGYAAAVAVEGEGETALSRFAAGG